MNRKKIYFPGFFGRPVLKKCLFDRSNRNNLRRVKTKILSLQNSTSISTKFILNSVELQFYRYLIICFFLIIFHYNNNKK